MAGPNHLHWEEFYPIGWRVCFGIGTILTCETKIYVPMRVKPDIRGPPHAGAPVQCFEGVLDCARLYGLAMGCKLIAREVSQEVVNFLFCQNNEDLDVIPFCNLLLIFID